jgi:hypothetical protein
MTICLVLKPSSRKDRLALFQMHHRRNRLQFGALWPDHGQLGNWPTTPHRAAKVEASLQQSQGLPLRSFVCFFLPN